MALSPFKIMAGFREMKDVVDNLNSIESDALTTIVNNKNFDYQHLLLSLMRLSKKEKKNIIAKTLSLAITRNVLMWQQIVDLAHHYPNDIGVLAPLYMNCLTLEPGEAMYIPTGTIHAYTKGICIELMGCSENVLFTGQSLLLESGSYEASGMGC